MLPEIGTFVHYNSEVNGHLKAEVVGHNEDETIDLSVELPTGDWVEVLDVPLNAEAEQFETWHYPEA